MRLAQYLVSQDLSHIVVFAVLLCLDKKCICRQASFGSEDFLFFLNQLLHLLDKVVFYFGKLVDFFHSRALAKGFIHYKMALAGSGYQFL